jgi:hypothetical protein
MPTVKSVKRLRTAATLLRMLPEERAFLDAATAQVASKLSAEHPSMAFGLSTFIMGASLREAAVVLGVTLDQWQAKGSKPKRKDGR